MSGNQDLLGVIKGTPKLHRTPKEHLKEALCNLQKEDKQPWDNNLRNLDLEITGYT